MLLIAMMMAAALAGDTGSASASAAGDSGARADLPTGIKPGTPVYTHDLLTPDTRNALMQESRDDKVNGTVYLTCHVDAHYVLDTCYVMDEKPSGHDLGKRAAFIALNARPPDLTKPHTPPNIWMSLVMKFVGG